MITLYDLDSKIEGRAHNINTWKVRYSLNYKGLPYKTVWVEYVDVQALGEKIGATPVVKDPLHGKLMYTLPIIHDDATGATVTDSILIAEYLDKTYPSTPRVLPEGSRALQVAFVEAITTKLASSPYFRFIAPHSLKAVNEASREYLQRTRSAWLGVAKLEDMLPSEETRDAEWAKVKDAFGVIDGWMKKEDEWVMGDTLSFADFALVGFVLMLNIPAGPNEREYKDLLSSHGGRWARLVENMKKYSAIH